MCAAFLGVVTVGFGTDRIRPAVFSGDNRTSDDVTVDISGNVDLFDASVAHTVSLTFKDSDYQRMLDSFWADGTKEYVEADLTIDGVRVPSVGIRLKGNSTLAGLTRDGEARPTSGRGGQQFGPPGGIPDGGIPGGGLPAMPGGIPNGGMGGGAGLAAENPETLPWLIRFDEFVEGRRYQGHREIAARVAGIGGGATVLNEALSLSLLKTAGETTQRYAYTSFTVNDRSTTARLLVEHPDENFAEQIGSSGVLYKALSTSSFTDQGDDPIAYQDDFKQINLKGSQDLQPVIDLIRWVNTASDAEFDAGLASRIDVESFARYVAIQNLLLNFDDMAGPGRNYYLWYDLSTKKFKVISWDHNLTFSGSATQGPHDAGGFGGFGNRGGQPNPMAPEGLPVPEGMEFPEGFTPPQQGGGPGGGFGGGIMSGHKLKERFLASKAFTALYDEAYRVLYQQLYASGRALKALDDISNVLATVNGYNALTGKSEVESLRSTIKQRTESLSTNEVISGG